MRDFDPTLVHISAVPLVKIGSMGKTVPELRDVGSALSVGANIVGGIIGADGAENAADTQAQAAIQSAKIQKQMYDTTREDLTPYREAGNSAQNALMYYLGIGNKGGYTDSYNLQDFLDYNRRYAPAWYGPEGQANDAQIQYDKYKAGGFTEKDIQELSDIYGFRKLNPVTNAYGDGTYGSLLKNFTGEDLQNEPGYQFGLAEGNKALDRRAASGGSYFSGAALKAAQRYGNDYASTKFNDAYNRDASNKNRIYSMLSGVADRGQNAAAQTGNAGSAAAAGMSSSILQGGNAIASGQVGSANALSGGISNALNAYQWNNMLSKYANPSTSYSPTYTYGTSYGE